MTNELHRRMLALESLGDDWDGYGAKPIPPHVISDVCRFLNWLPADLVNQLLFVVPKADGGIQLEWHGPTGRLFELEFDSSVYHGWLKWHPPEGVADEGEWHVYELASALDAIRWATDTTEVTE